jgi:hypothetical protein
MARDNVTGRFAIATAGTPDSADDDPGQGSPLRAQRPGMVPDSDAEHPVYGRQGAVIRAAARAAGMGGPVGHVMGVDDAPGPAGGTGEAAGE